MCLEQNANNALPMPNRKFRAVTTFNAAGRKLYGNKMLQCFFEFWPQDVEIALYRDGFEPETFAPWVIDRGDINEIDWLSKFKARHAKNQEANGMGGRRDSKGRYSYNWDAVKFSHSVAARITEAERAVAEGIDVLIWVDGDTVTHSSVTREFLEQLMPHQWALAWLDRENIYPDAQSAPSQDGCIAGVVAFDVRDGQPVQSRPARLARLLYAGMGG
jgi:hypothetical protein